MHSVTVANLAFILFVPLLISGCICKIICVIFNIHDSDDDENEEDLK